MLTLTALQCKNRLHLNINLPGTQNLPSMDSNSANYQYTPQYGGVNFSHSENQHNIPGTEHAQIGQIPGFPPDIQNNIRKVGAHMIAHLCPSVLIRMYVSWKSFPDQSYLQRSHFNVKSLWAQLKITTYQPYFSQFVEAVSTYTGILCHIKFTIKGPLPKALQVYDFSFKSMHTIML